MLDGASRMCQPLPACPSESWLNAAVSCSGAAQAAGRSREEGGLGGVRNGSGGGLAAAAGLRPPPLFRALGRRGASSTSLPPHRRLRSMLQRSRAVLPDGGPHGLGSWKDSSSKALTFWDAHATSAADDNKPHSNPIIETSTSGSLEPSTELPEKAVRKRVLLRTCSHPEVPTDKEGGGRGFPWERETRSLSLTGIRAEVAVPLQWCSEGPDEGCPDRGLARGRGLRGSSSRVCPERWSEQPSVWRRRERQQVEKGARKRRRGGRQQHPAAPEGHREEEAGLCQWLQSLGFSEEREESTTNRGRSALGGGGGGGDVARPRFKEQSAGRRGWVVESDGQQTHQRRDRRPHFLPPIPQTTTSPSSSSALLYVPLLLPENSPPPSRCASPKSPCSPLPVPLLTHLPLPPCKRRDFKTVF